MILLFEKGIYALKCEQDLHSNLVILLLKMNKKCKICNKMHLHSNLVILLLNKKFNTDYFSTLFTFQFGDFTIKLYKRIKVSRL